MKSAKFPSAEETLRQAKAIVAAAQEAVRDALIAHKRAGLPIVVCEADKVRWVPADEIVIPNPPRRRGK